MGVEVLAGKWTSGLGLKEEERDKKIKLACPIKQKNSKISRELKREAIRIDEWGVGKDGASCVGGGQRQGSARVCFPWEKRPGDFQEQASLICTNPAIGSTAICKFSSLLLTP